MNRNMKTMLGIGSLMLALVSIPASLKAEGTAAGFVDFGSFTKEEIAQDFVEVNISSNIIGLAAQLAKDEPEVLDLLKGLKSIRVNVLKVTDENKEAIKARIAKVRESLKDKNWETLVTATKEKQDVNVSIKTQGAEAIEGVVVTVIEGGKQAVLINIVGHINPEKISTLGERFNIDPLKEIAPKKVKKT